MSTGRRLKYTEQLGAAELFTKDTLMDTFYEGFKHKKYCGFEQPHKPHIYRGPFEWPHITLVVCPGVKDSDICYKHRYKLVRSTRDFHTYSCKKCGDVVTVSKEEMRK